MSECLLVCFWAWPVQQRGSCDGGILVQESDRRAGLDCEIMFRKVKKAKTYEGKSRGSESRCEPALLDPSLPPDILYAFFAGEEEGKCAGLDDEPADIRVVNTTTQPTKDVYMLTRKQRLPGSSRGAMHPNCTACDHAA